jgi:hypothetical protein
MTYLDFAKQHYIGAPLILALAIVGTALGFSLAVECYHMAIYLREQRRRNK